MKQTTSRLASRRFHQWLVPEKTVMGIFSLGIILVFVGAVLMAVATVSSGALSIIGGVLLSVGLILLLLSICLCTHAWCIWYVRDVETQTIQTTVVGTDSIDGDWMSPYGVVDKRPPNGMLRDGRQTGSLSSKKHVTISPRSQDVFLPNTYYHGKQGDTSRSSDQSSTRGPLTPSQKSGPGSSSSDMSTLASFRYLHDPSLSTPYSSLNQKRQAQIINVPVSVQNGYGSAQRHTDAGRTVQVRPYHSEHGNVLPMRRHSDDDYDNTGDLSPMLQQQTFQQVSPSHQWQSQGSPWQQQPWQQTHGPSQQTVWQYQSVPASQTNRRQMSPVAADEPPPPQPMVYPSARRPMTFEQISSSKVSLYDNIIMGKRDDFE